MDLGKAGKNSKIQLINALEVTFKNSARNYPRGRNPRKTSLNSRPIKTKTGGIVQNIP